MEQNNEFNQTEGRKMNKAQLKVIALQDKVQDALKLLEDSYGSMDDPYDAYFYQDYQHMEYLLNQIGCRLEDLRVDLEKGAVNVS